MQLPIKIGNPHKLQTLEIKKQYELALIRTEDFWSFKSTLGQDSVPHAIAEIA